MNLDFYKDLLNKDKFFSDFFESYALGYLDYYFINLPHKYREVVKNNDITIFKDYNDVTSISCHVSALPNWNNLETAIERDDRGNEITATVDEFKEQLYLEYVKFSFKYYEKKILEWKLELIDSGDSKSILEELEKITSKLNYYESEINESEFLQPYLSPIQDSFIFFRNEIERIKKNFNTEQAYLNTDITPKTKKETSNGRGFFYTGKIESLYSLTTITDNIWRYFKDRGLIATNTKFSEFNKIFTHNIIKEKTVWLGDINQLYYFIKLLMNQNTYKSNRNKQKWEITVNCFCLNNQQEILTEQLKSTKEPKTDKKMEILEAINFFTKLR